MKSKFEIIQHQGTAGDINDNGKYSVNSKNLQNKKIFVPFSLPGEEILFEELKYKKTSYYVFKSIISNKNQHRINPLCKHFTTCGGCLLQHMNEEFYKEYKTNRLKKYFDNEINHKINEISIIPNGLRRKANFEAIKKEEKIFMGFHRFNSRQIINLETCKILRAEIVDIMESLKDLLNKILENFQKAEFFIILAGNGLDIGLEIQKVKVLSDKQHEIINMFCNQNKNITRFIFRHGNKYQTVYQKTNKEKPFLEFGVFKVNINPWAFMQTSKEAENVMIDCIKSIIDKTNKYDKMIDLFSGRGTYSLSLINYFKKITSVELEDDSINELANVAQKNNLNISTIKQDLFRTPVTHETLNSYDLIIINPPRAGAENQSIEISKSEVRNIIYISCNPETFGRDWSILRTKYDIEFIQPIDQFIWSNHLEIIVWLRIKN